MKKNLSILYILLLAGYHVNSQVATYRQDIIQFRSAQWKSLIGDPRTTLLPKDSIYLDYYPIKEQNKVYCKVDLIHDQQIVEMPTYSGKLKTFKKYATLHFKWKGIPLSLTTYLSLPNLTNPLSKDYLFIPFKDKTTGDQTYGGGRYLDIHTSQIQQGHVLIDLNQVYNPWCAYSDGYNCPIPPIENTLPIRLKAGEKKFKKSH